MMVQVIATVIGVILSSLVTIGLFILAGIKESQDNTNKEIKEMNADIREMFVKMAENHERVQNSLQRIEQVEGKLDKVEIRILELEKAA